MICRGSASVVKAHICTYARAKASKFKLESCPKWARPALFALVVGIHRNEIFRPGNSPA